MCGIKKDLSCVYRLKTDSVPERSFRFNSPHTEMFSTAYVQFKYIYLNGQKLIDLFSLTTPTQGEQSTKHACHMTHIQADMN